MTGRVTPASLSPRNAAMAGTSNRGDVFRAVKEWARRHWARLAAVASGAATAVGFLLALMDHYGNAATIAAQNERHQQIVTMLRQLIAVVSTQRELLNELRAHADVPARDVFARFERVVANDAPDPNVLLAEPIGGPGPARWWIAGTVPVEPAGAHWWIGFRSGSRVWPRLEVTEPAGHAFAYALVGAPPAERGEIVLLDVGAATHAQLSQSLDIPQPGDGGIYLPHLRDVTVRDSIDYHNP